MRRLITIAVIGALSFVSNAVFAQQVTFSLTPANTNTTPGTQVCLDVIVMNFDSIVSMQYSINYDETVLDFDMAQNINLPGMTVNNVGNPFDGDLTVSWLANDVVNGESVPDGTSIFEICFTALAGGTSDITFSGTPTPIEVTDVHGIVSPVFNNASITVAGGAADPTFTASDETAANGSQVCVDIAVENFDSIISMQYSINFDDAILQYDMAQGLNLPGFTNANVGNPSDGNLTVSWLASDPVAGESVADGTVIFEVCFTVLGSGGAQSGIDFSGTPTPIEVTGPSGILSPMFNDGSVTATGGGGGGDLAFTASDETAANGSQVCVDISVENFTDIVSMQFSINFDDAILQYDMAQGFNLPGFTNANVGNPSDGNLTVSWLANDPVAGESVADGTVIFEVCFTVLGSGGQQSGIDFSGTPTPIEVTDPSGILSPLFNDGSVTATGSGGGTDLIFTASDETAANGSQVCVDISVENFTDIVSMQFSINFDDAILQYDMAQGFNLPGFSGASVGNPSDGNLTVSWLANDPVAGESVADGTVIFEICFTVLGSGGQQSGIDFSGTPTPIEVTDPSGILSPVFNDGSVTATGSGGGTDLIFTASDETAANGAQVCVDISVENFTDIVSMQYSINFDDAILQYDMVQGFNLPGFTASSVGNPSDGNLTVSWLANDPVAGESVADGTVIFEICFTVLGSGGQQSGIDFSGTPTPIEVTDPSGILSPVFNDGSVTATGGGGGTDLIFTASDETAANGAQVCVDISVENFTDIVSMQYSINFDDAVLQYDMVQGFNLPGFTASSVGNPSDGNLTVSWLANDPVAGESVANGTVIFEICFTVLGSGGSQSGIDFSGTPTPVEVTDPSGILSPVFNDGSVTVTGVSTDLTFTASDENGDPGSQVCVDISVQNFTDIVSMQYSINFDDAVLQFDMAQGFNLPGFTASSVGNPSDGNITVSWLANDPVAGESVADGTVIFELCFTILGAGGSQSDISFSSTPTPVEVTDPSGILSPVFNNGSVTANGSGGGGDLTFTASDETTEPGAQVCVEVSVENFTDIVSMQYSLNYDDAVLQFDMAQGFNLPGFTASSVGNPSAGNITVSWLANDPVVGESVANGTVIFELCFTVIGSGGSQSGIDFSGNPTPIEVTDPSGVINPVFNDGSVTVETVIGPNDFAVILNDVNVQSGDMFCIDLSVQNFTDMVSFQFSINYPGNLLSYTGAENFNLQGFTASNVGNPGGPTSGNLTFSWLADDVVLGETIADGTVIVQLCFEAIGPNCSTADVVFSGTPTPVEVTDINGPVVFNWNGSTVLICDAQPLALRASDETVSPGSMACVDIRAIDGFINIDTMQFSIAYDETILDFTGVQGITLAGMTPANVGNPSAGELTIDWVSPMPAGTTVPDNTVLFDLCFEATGVNGEVSPINFTDTPLPTHATNPNATVPFMGDDGSVTIDGVCPPIQLAATTAKSCVGIGTGSIDLTATGGDDTYTYEWSNGETTEDVNGLSAGSYTVTVSSCGAMAVESFTVGSFPSININPTIVDVACFGGNTGAIFITVQGAAPFSYNWSGPGSIPNPGSQNITGLIAGEYTVSVTDGNGCLNVSSFLVKQPDAALSINLMGTTTVSCFGESDGAIEVEVVGGTPDYTYIWTPGLPDTSNPTGVSAGNYNLQVVDANSCTVSLNDIEVVEPEVLEVSLVNLVNETGIGSNGSVDINVMGGTGPYDYFWEGPGGPYITQDINNLVSGVYGLTVTDGNGCEATFSAEIIKPLEIILDAFVHPCGGQADGSISITVSGGNEPYAFFWTGPIGTGPFFTEDISGLGGGNYSLTLTDFSGQQEFLQVTLIEPALPLQISSFTVVNPTGPTTCDGAIFLNSIVGGTPPYTFYWSNTAVTTSITNLCEATYSVTVTDDNGCTVIEEFLLEFIPLPLILDLNASENASCYASANGEWTISIEGGVSPFTFAYSDTFSTLSIDGVVTRNDLAAGTYDCTITDSSNPPQTMTVDRTISEPTQLQLSVLQLYPATGTLDNGAVNITAMGGTFPYEYQWNTGFDGPDPNNLADSCYQLTIIDANGCENVFADICIPRFEISGYAITDNFCQSDEEGAIMLTVDGGINEPLSYTWVGSNGQPLVNPDSNQVNNLPPGEYTVYVSDALGVTTAAEIIVIGYSSEVIASAEATTDFNGFPVSCPDETDGAAEVTVQLGEAPFTYAWMGGLGNGPTVDGLGEGTYYVVVTDDFGCVDTTSVTLNAPTPVAFEADITDVSCAGEIDGEIFLDMFGGAGNISVVWDDPKSQKTNPVIFLGGDIYTVTITDGNGCEQVASFEVYQPAPLVVDLVTTPDDGSHTGTIAANVSGGTAPYTYHWNTGRPDDTGSFLEDLPSGEFAVMVTDANGCITTVAGFIANSNIDCLEFRNVITPDGDGMNEEFQINCLNLYLVNNLKIFNRWGQLVYETDNYVNDWAGVNRLGEDLPEGAYFFVFQYQDQGSMQQLKGHITLIR